MTVPLSLATPSPLSYFASLVARDEDFALLEAAIAIAQDEHPDIDLCAAMAEIDTLAQKLSARLPADAPDLHRLRQLNRFFFQEQGFAGNVNDYEASDNSYLHRVLSTRRGIPISLAMIYLALAEQIGLQVHGVSFPGHFLVKVSLPAGEVIIDPFTGESLSRARLDERLEPYRQQRGLVGDFEMPLGLFLQAAGPRDILARMLRNLKALHAQADRVDLLLAVQQRLVLLLPDDWAERRDRGLLLAELGEVAQAREDLAAYLVHCGDAADGDEVRQRLQALSRAS